MSERILPKAKGDSIVTQQLEDELLVYDLGNDRAHSLNRLAASVWHQCDGSSTRADIFEAIKPDVGVDVSKDHVDLALLELANAGLLDAFTSEDTGLNRRKLIKRVGIAAAASLPVVASLAMPSSALAAGSAAAPGSPCSSPIDCQSGACFGSPQVCL